MIGVYTCFLVIMLLSSNSNLISSQTDLYMFKASGHSKEKEMETFRKVKHLLEYGEKQKIFGKFN